MVDPGKDYAEVCVWSVWDHTVHPQLKVSCNYYFRECLLSKNMILWHLCVQNQNPPWLEYSEIFLSNHWMHMCGEG